MVEQATVIGGRAMRLQSGPFLVLPIHAVETNSRAPVGARVTPEQAVQIQDAARKAALVTGMITEEQIERRILPLAIFPQSVNPEVAALSVLALRVLVEISPDKRSMEMGYWRSWLANHDRKKALAASVKPQRHGGAEDGGEGDERDEGGKQKAEGGEVEQNAPAGVAQTATEAALCGGGMHGKKVSALADQRFCVAMLTTEQAAKKKAADQEWMTALSVARPDWAGLVSDAEKDKSVMARLYLYQRKADGNFDCLERWPAKKK